MTPERAKEIKSILDWKNGGCLLVGGKGPQVPPVTDAEDDYIHQVWDGMPGHTCYYDALLRIIRGEV